jgi:hypothetical protein
MDFKKEWLLLVIVFVIGSFFGYFIHNPSNVAYVVIEGGGTGDSGDQEIDNPNYGAVKGTVSFVIKDNDVVINREPAPGKDIYMIHAGTDIEDWDRVIDSGEDFEGLIENLDADGDGSRCSSNSYDTDLMFYDKDGNGKKDKKEKYVYHIQTDNNGCFGLKVAADDYDIYVS